VNFAYIKKFLLSLKRSLKPIRALMFDNFERRA